MAMQRTSIGKFATYVTIARHALNALSPPGGAWTTHVLRCVKFDKTAGCDLLSDFIHMHQPVVQRFSSAGMQVVKGIGVLALSLIVRSNAAMADESVMRPDVVVSTAAQDRKSTRLNSSHVVTSRMPSSA